MFACLNNGVLFFGQKNWLNLADSDWGDSNIRHSYCIIPCDNCIGATTIETHFIGTNKKAKGENEMQNDQNEQATQTWLTTILMVMVCAPAAVHVLVLLWFECSGQRA